MSPQEASGAVAEPWPYEPRPAAASEPKQDASSRKRLNPYVTLAALLVVLAVSWVPIVLGLIWLF